MTVTANTINYGVPVVDDDLYIVIHPSGTGLEVNPGDWVSFSGQYGIATHDGVAYFKASGLGVAMDRNPVVDWQGRTVVNSGLLVATRGIFRVSANFSGQPNLGLGVFPDMTGSAVNAPSGVTGLSTVWNTAAPVNVSGATAAAPSKNVAQLIKWYDTGPAGTGQMDIRLFPARADYY